MLPHQARSCLSVQKTSGVIRQGVEFDGVDDYITVTDDDSLDSPEITMSAWVYIDENPTSGGDIVSKGGNSGYRVTINDDREVGFFFELFTNFGISDNPIPLNEWTHLVVTVASDKTYLYINGVIDIFKDQTYSLLSTAFDLIIGASVIHGNYFDGKIDDVRIYDRALSAEEIQHLYELGN